MIRQCRMAYVSLTSVTVGVALLVPTVAVAQECSRASEAAPESIKLSKKVETITLTPDLQSDVVNFGGDRGDKEIDFVFDTSRRLPADLMPSHLALEVPRRWRRADT